MPEPRYYNLRARLPRRHSNQFTSFITNLKSGDGLSFRGQFLATLMRSLRRTPPDDFFHPPKYEPELRASMPTSFRAVADGLEVPTTIFIYNAVRRFHESRTFRYAVLREFSSAYPFFTLADLQTRLQLAYADDPLE